MTVFFTLATLLAASLGRPIEMLPQAGHNDTVSAVAVSSDGAYALSGSFDRSLRLFDLASGKEIRVLRGHTEAVRAVAFSKDGRRAISASSDRTLRTWELATGRQLSSLPIACELVTFDVNAESAVCSDSFERTARILDLRTGKALRSFTAEEKVESAAMSARGTYFAAASRDYKINVFDGRTGKRRHAMETGASSHEILAFSPTQEALLVVTTIDGALLLFDAEAGRLLRTLRARSTVGTTAVAFSPDGRTLLTHASDNAFHSYDVASGQEVWSRADARSYCGSIEFSRDGRFFIAGSIGAVQIWDAAARHPLRVFDARAQAVSALALSHDGRRALFGGGDGFALWDLPLLKRAHALSHKRAPGEGRSVGFVAAFSPNDELAVTVERAKNDVHPMRLWDVTSGRELRSFAKPPKHLVRSVAFSPDGKYVLSTDDKFTAALWAVATGELIRSFKGHAQYVTEVAFSPNGAIVVTASADRTLRFWEVSSGKQLRRVDASDAPRSLRFSADGKRFAAFIGVFVRIFDVETGQQLREVKMPAELTRDPHGFLAVELSHDFRALALGFDDGRIALVDLSVAPTWKTLRGHGATVTALASTDGGARLLSGSDDGTARLWDVATLRSVAMMSSQEGEWLVHSSVGDFFDGSPGGGELVAMVDGMHGMSVDQLAFKLNRPDLILEQMRLGTPEIIEHYRAQHERRLKRAGLTAADLGSGVDLPLARITTVDRAASGEDVTITAELSDKHGLKGYQLYVNGVPLFAGAGKALQGKSARVVERAPLGEGANKIELSARNMSGQESLRALSLVESSKAITGDLYFLGFGVSDYADPEVADLSFAHKDVVELGQAFAASRGFANVRVETRINERVTKQAFHDAKSFLAAARPQDTVVLFIAGHGLHAKDASATYYFLTHETKVADLESTAAPFELIEELLDGVSARQKLFLMDTCESGEVDGEGIARASTQVAQGVKARGLRAGDTTGKESRRSWLLARDRLVYQDLTRRTGAVVFSSSRGGELSYESSAFENGLFSEALLKALREGAGDENGDGVITAGELRAFVSTEVTRVSGGLQHPTVDRDNLAARIAFGVR